MHHIEAREASRVPCCITLLQYYKKRNATMPRKPIDRDAVRRADAQLDQLLQEPPELCEPNPARRQALEGWLESHQQEETDDATPEDR